ncbi:MAG TPA: formate/nitrite transporter family protein [Tissierellia bacterium]|nr:formate/nitrite transporter family protein [Tissierellia bacterium]
MTKAFLSPAEITETTINNGIDKANRSFLSLLMLSILAGIYIGFGAHAYFTITQAAGSLNAGIAKFLGGAVFPIGLLLVAVAGGELFTGNCLMTMSLMDRKISAAGLLRNWIIVYIGNFIGSIILAKALVFSNAYAPGSLIADTAFSVATSKISQSAPQILVKGILANMLVCLAVWLACGAQDIGSKVVAIWFPVMTFVMVGFEHSIANMFFLPVAKFAGLEITWSQIWFNNIIPSTIGNIIGGGIIIPIMYYLAYRKPKANITAKTAKLNSLMKKQSA